ncbi:hypothetical protein [Mucilaginibacter glaciei]|uniref:Uncharacterized protein n=1 Tax=Mucilaginibacter glaciei TaxID=2772109 RepID=A0A926NN66_9SPHI|nr:hypothetical protein [Mucilaginibacter glaciei]MBD1395159.1 hypothetical protein [Mucilaginibacter glaciei]
MSWIKFALWLSGIYSMYYAAIILWDFFRGGRSPADERSHELSFTEHIEAVQAGPEATAEIYGSSVISSGGVSLKQLFNLAREEAIEFTRPVSF